jgi:hypothetical protein
MELLREVQLVWIIGGLILECRSRILVFGIGIIVGIDSY